MITIEIVESASKLFGVATNRKRNMVYSVETKERIVDWDGPEITAACAVGNTIVCSALDGHVYLVTLAGIEDIKHEKTGTWFEAVAPLDQNRCLFGGTFGQLMELDLTTGRFEYSTLTKHGIPKPGRRILSMLARGSDLLILGDKEMLLSYRCGAITCCSPGRPNSEISFNRGAIIRDTVWIVGWQLGPDGILIEYDLPAGSFTSHPLAISDMHLPAISALNEKLYLGGKEVHTGWPGSWKKVGDFGANAIIRMVKEPNWKDSLLAVGYTGRTMAFPLA